MLIRTVLYGLLIQLLAIIVIAAAIPGGASWLTLVGYVTAFYDHNVFALHIVSVPWTDPAVFISLQTSVQMLAVAMAAAGLITLARTNPWQHGVLPDSAPPGRDKTLRDPPTPAPAPMPPPGGANSSTVSAPPPGPAAGGPPAGRPPSPPSPMPPAPGPVGP